MKTPADQMKTPADQMKTPADQWKTPSDQSKTPPDQSKTPAHSSKTPARSLPVLRPNNTCTQNRSSGTISGGVFNAEFAERRKWRVPVLRPNDAFTKDTKKCCLAGVPALFGRSTGVVWPEYRQCPSLAVCQSINILSLTGDEASQLFPISYSLFPIPYSLFP